MSKNIVNIAIIGFGNIGSYFYKMIESNKKLISLKTNKLILVKYICAKSPSKKRSTKIPQSKWFKDPIKLVKKKDVDIVVELIGGSGGIAKKIVFEALKNKKHVITANKALIAKYGNELGYIAEKNKVNLEFEASVAAGIPIIRSIKEGININKINKICGILNGTTNYILSEMENTGKSFSSVLEKAKKYGFAEANPLSDLNGSDAVSKIKILSSIAFNTLISSNKILKEGIQGIKLIDIYHAKKLGYKIKLLAISEVKENKLIERVHPCLVLDKSYIANINGVLNAIIVDATPIGRTVYQGEGAGPGPTSSALLSDLCSIAKGNIQYPFGTPNELQKRISKFDISKTVYSSYLRIEVNDKPGVLTVITKVFSKNRISIKNLVQLPDKNKKLASIALITHKNIEKNFKNLLKDLHKNKFVVEKPTFIRVEKL